MSEVLDQSEIDALLAAAGTSGVEEAPVATERAPWAATAGATVKPYDFKRPERVSKEQMRALEAIHETFARNLGASLSGFLRTIVEVRVATAEQLTYSEFIHALPNPTNFNLLSAEPLQGQLCLELSPIIIYPIIDRLLGGSSSEVFIPQRPLTLIELRLVRCITDRAVASLTEVWSELVDVKFELREVESNPHLVQIVAPNEVVIVLGMEIRLGSRAGTMSLCIPYKVIEPVMEKLASQGWVAYQRQAVSEKRETEIARNIAATWVDLRAFLAQTTITVRELKTLAAGDIIQTAKPRTADLILQVNGLNTFAGALGRHKDHFALRITRRAEVEEPL
ncbi:MAG: flagellar motor switch protein FliM [Planctomycetota bacterium]|nr:MAG: flagellar motor switch protein FliM [Planctomycetota bacterium]